VTDRAERLHDPVFKEPKMIRINDPGKKREKEALPLSRRDFIKLTGLAGMGAVLPSCNMTEEIPPPTEHRNVIIIGSGFGGAITALRLAENGIEATLIEKGRRWPISPEGDTFSRYIYPDGRSTWLRCATVVPIGPPLPINRYAGVLEGHFYCGLRVLTGSCYGGGSIVYGGLLVKPPEHLFSQVFPPEIGYSEMEPYYQRVDDMLVREPVPEDIYQSDYFKHYRVVEEQNTNAGLPTARIKSASDYDIVRDEINGLIAPSIIHGEAIYGVNSGAKKSLDTSYLAQAEQTGLLEVKTLHQVKHIGRDGEGYLVQVEEIDEKGRVKGETVYACNYLFLAAGSIGTSNLLVKAKAKGFLEDLNCEVGEGWGNNGNVEVLRTDVGATGQWQGGPPATAVVDHDNPISPLFIEHPQFPLGFECSCLLYFGIGIHSTRGKFVYNPLTDGVELSWPARNNDQETINQAMMYTMEKLNIVNGGNIGSFVGGAKGYQDDAVYHPLGGAVMGKACDFFGRVKNYPNLYVNDSALIPGFTAAANPSFTVAAIAERNIETIIQEDF